jgi:uncharacterized protein (DUF924 family)
MLRYEVVKRAAAGGNGESPYHKAMAVVSPEAVLEFWFGPAVADAEVSICGRAEWFRKDPAFDALIRSRFRDTIDIAVAGGLGEWCTMPRGALARVIVLDQFTRNVARDTAAAFAGDARALATAQDAIARGFDRQLQPLERWFLYMPFVHCEDLACQQESVRLFRALAEETGLVEPLPWAERHAGVIQRFGRFPHRNRALGRTPTPEEEAFLAKHGSRF